MSAERGRLPKRMPSDQHGKRGAANNSKHPEEYDDNVHAQDANPHEPLSPQLLVPNVLPEVLRDTDGALCNGVIDGAERVDTGVLPDVIPSFQSHRREVTVRPPPNDARHFNRPVEPDLIYSEHPSLEQHGNNDSDDMERYFDANSHMFPNMHSEESNDNQVTSPCRSGNCQCVLEYHISHGSSATRGRESDIDTEGHSDIQCEGWQDYEKVPGVTDLPTQSSPTPSSDDHGDFIEADLQSLPRRTSYTSSISSESKDSATSSYEELPTLTLQDNEDVCDMNADGSGPAESTVNKATCDHICPSCNNLCQGQLFRRRNPLFGRPDFSYELPSRANDSEESLSPRAAYGACATACQSSDNREADRPVAYVRPSILNPLTGPRPSAENNTRLFESTPNSESGSSFKTTSMSLQSPNFSEFSPYDCNASDPSPFLSPEKESSSLDSVEGRDFQGQYSSGVGGARSKDMRGQSMKNRSASASEEAASLSGLYKCDCARRQSNPEASSCPKPRAAQSNQGDVEAGDSYDPCAEEQDCIEPPMRNIFYFRGPELRPENDPHLALGGDDTETDRFLLTPPGVRERTFSNPSNERDGREASIPTRRSVRGVLMYHDYDTYNGNNLNPAIEVSRSEQHSQLFNVSRQTSTSNFDQDENSFQEMSADSETDCFSNLTSQSDSPPAIPCRPDLIGAVSAAAESRYECVNLPDGAIGAQAMSMDRRIVDEADAYEEVRHYTSDWIRKVSKFVDKHYVKKLMNEGKLYEDVEDPETREEANKIRDRNNTVDKVLNQTDDDRNVLYSIFVRDYVLGNLRSIHRPVWYVPTPGERDIERVMLWTEYQAYVLQVKQIGKSACGATSVANALKVFEIYTDKDKLCDSIVTNQRAENAALGEYLISRSRAGVTADCLINCVSKVTKGGLYGRFFCTYPARDFELRKWLAVWMKKGAVPILTLNLQRGVPPGYAVPDAWHHQMVYGVGPKGLYLTNPQEVIPERVIMEQLTSESVLMVRRRDVIARWQDEDADNLGPLLQAGDQWRELNVIGQTLSVLREERGQLRVPGFRPRLTAHVTVPAWYRPGITLLVQAESAEYHELINEPELPEKTPDAPDRAPEAPDTTDATEKAAGHDASTGSM